MAASLTQRWWTRLASTLSVLLKATRSEAAHNTPDSKSVHADSTVTTTKTETNRHLSKTT
ncbi:hypothetical protein E2C01_006343 [Portunus trituberculatus]|uniref:Uncharacterized protein n=1 Tax=Portunus trituberculatus TaxID=210409 RepID=A0A5B7D1K3_PORTR|nr:hypothetical protein [Portunus trituberculatus]